MWGPEVRAALALESVLSSVRGSPQERMLVTARPLQQSARRQVSAKHRVPVLPRVSKPEWPPEKASRQELALEPARLQASVMHPGSARPWELFVLQALRQASDWDLNQATAWKPEISR